MTTPTRPPVPIRCDRPDCRCERDEEVRWLAITVRRGLLTIVRAIEIRYQIEDKGKRAA